MKDWNPTEYLRFEAERTRPSRDLAARIEVESPKDLVDIGCGPGNSTRVLRERWPESSILGLDSSEAMIEQARKDCPEGKWIVADAAAFDAPEAYDVVFSNATLQWIPCHETLVPRLFAALRPGGALAVQVPMFSSMPISAAIDRVAKSARWKELAGDRGEGFTFCDAAFYYDLLCTRAGAARIDLWETSYDHVMPSREAVVDFVRYTGLRPYLDVLSGEDERAEFLGDLLREVEKAYPSRADGKVLFPFKRLFFIAYK
jgi:trans-aconitate 2-methyltransferase